MRMALLIALPAAIGLVLLASPLIATLFYGGEFGETSVRMTTLALQAYALGLIGFSFVKILAPAFFAREDTKTPVRVGIAALAVNLVLGVSLAWYLTHRGFAGPHVGLAAATSVAAIVNALLLYRGLQRDRVVQHAPGWRVFISRVLIANSVMWQVLWLLRRPLEWWLQAAQMQRISWLAVSVTVGAASYFLCLLLLGMRPSQLRM